MPGIDASPLCSDSEEDPAAACKPGALDTLGSVKSWSGKIGITNENKSDESHTPSAAELAAMCQVWVHAFNTATTQSQSPSCD